MLRVAILAGGLATRLRPVTTRVPKALIQVAGEPFLAHQLRLLRTAGIEHVVLCVGHLGDQIQQYVGNGAAFGLDVRYACDGPSQLGTAGAIRNALPLLGSTFFVLYGDSYLPCDYRAVERAFFASGLDALMTVLRNDDQWDRSNVAVVDGDIVAYDKSRRTPQMRHIDYGLGIFSAFLFDHAPRELPWDLMALYRDVLHRQRLAAYEVSERFFEVGSWNGIKDFEAHMSAPQAATR